MAKISPESETREEEIPLCEASIRYAKEWILMQVTGQDSYGCPSGVVLLHSPSQEEVSSRFNELMKQKNQHLAMSWGARYRHITNEEGQELAQKLNEVIRTNHDGKS